MMGYQRDWGAANRCFCAHRAESRSANGKGHGSSSRPLFHMTRARTCAPEIAATECELNEGEISDRDDMASVSVSRSAGANYSESVARHPHLPSTHPRPPLPQWLGICHLDVTCWLLSHC